MKREEKKEYVNFGAYNGKALYSQPSPSTLRPQDLIHSSLAIIKLSLEDASVLLEDFYGLVIRFSSNVDTSLLFPTGGVAAQQDKGDDHGRTRRGEHPHGEGRAAPLLQAVGGSRGAGGRGELHLPARHCLPRFGHRVYRGR